MNSDTLVVILCDCDDTASKVQVKRQKIGICYTSLGFSSTNFKWPPTYSEPVKSPKVSIHSMIIVFAFILSLVGRSPDDQRACSVQVT